MGTGVAVETGVEVGTGVAVATAVAVGTGVATGTGTAVGTGKGVRTGAAVGIGVTVGRVNPGLRTTTTSRFRSIFNVAMLSLSVSTPLQAISEPAVSG